jgi:hypothetical protein
MLPATLAYRPGDPATAHLLRHSQRFQRPVDLNSTSYGSSPAINSSDALGRHQALICEGRRHPDVDQRDIR